MASYTLQRRPQIWDLHPIELVSAGDYRLCARLASAPASPVCVGAVAANGREADAVLQVLQEPQLGFGEIGAVPAERPGVQIEDAVGELEKSRLHAPNGVSQNLGVVHGPPRQIGAGVTRCPLVNT